MLEKLQEILEAECGLTHDRPLLLAVSGGPDSLCLLDVIVRLGYDVHVAHLDHTLRAESSDEAEQVRLAAQERGLPFYLAEANVRAYSVESRLSIEEAARNLRYRFLFLQAEQIGAQAVATGHTADDQVESVLMHLLRGSALAGLQGMAYRTLPNPWSQQRPLVRPLLGVWREEIMEYIQARSLMPVSDASNFDVSFYRNRLRLELIPQLEQINPGVRQRIWQMADVIRQDYEVLNQAIDAAWSACWLSSGQDWIAFSLAALRGHPVALQRHLLRRAILILRPGLRDLDYAALERGQKFITQPPHSRQSDLLARLRLQQEGNQLVLAGWQIVKIPLPDRDWPSLAAGEIEPLSLPADVPLAGGWRFQARMVNDLEVAHQQAAANTDPYRAWIDAGALTEGLHLRTRQPGDRFRPLGLDGHSIKLSEFMINAKLPAAARSNWPLVVCGDQIVWVAGLRLAHPYRLTEASQAAVQLILARSDLAGSAEQEHQDHPCPHSNEPEQAREIV